MYSWISHRHIHLKKNSNMQSFETIWQTIKDDYFDPTFGGVDWNDTYGRYKPQVETAKNEEEYYLLINKMLFELNVSHIGFVPPDDLHLIEPVLSAEGSIGIQVRMVDDNAVISSVTPESPSAQAGLQAGYIIKSINGNKIEDSTAIKYIDECDFSDIEKQKRRHLKILMPPYNERNRKCTITSAILEKINGPPDTTISISYIDGNANTHEKKIVRTKHKGRIVIDDAMPPVFVEFNAERLANNIGYICFNAFLPPVDHMFIKAIDSMTDISGLIIDIRGNPGGFFPVRKALAEKIIQKRTLFWRYKERNQIRNVYLDPSQNPYDGPVAILIDVMSASSSEEFAGGMKAINRAVIVGERSPGRVLIMKTLKLENGGVLIYPFGQTRTMDDHILEGNGVMPDIEVNLNRKSLLQGKDAQLEAAINFLNKKATMLPV